MGLLQLLARGLWSKPMLSLQVVEMEKLEAAWTHAIEMTSLVLILFGDRENICCFLILILQKFLDVPLQVRLGELLFVEVSIPNHFLIHIVSILNIQSFGRTNSLINHVLHVLVLTCWIPWAFRDLWRLLAFYKSKITSNYFVWFFCTSRCSRRFNIIDIRSRFPLFIKRVHTLGTLLV